MRIFTTKPVVSDIIIITYIKFAEIFVNNVDIVMLMFQGRMGCW